MVSIIWAAGAIAFITPVCSIYITWTTQTNILYDLIICKKHKISDNKMFN